MAIGPTSLTEALFIAVLLLGAIAPSITIAIMRREEQAIRGDARSPSPQLSIADSGNGIGVRTVIRHLCFGILALLAAFLVAGVFAAARTPAQPDRTVTPAELVIVVSLIGGVLVMNACTVWAYRVRDRAVAQFRADEARARLSLRQKPKPPPGDV